MTADRSPHAHPRAAVLDVAILPVRMRTEPSAQLRLIPIFCHAGQTDIGSTTRTQPRLLRLLRAAVVRSCSRCSSIARCAAACVAGEGGRGPRAVRPARSLIAATGVPAAQRSTAVRHAAHWHSAQAGSSAVVVPEK